MDVHPIILAIIFVIGWVGYVATTILMVKDRTLEGMLMFAFTACCFVTWIGLAAAHWYDSGSQVVRSAQLGVAMWLPLGLCVMIALLIAMVVASAVRHRHTSAPEPMRHARATLSKR